MEAKLQAVITRLWINIASNYQEQWWDVHRRSYEYERLGLIIGPLYDWHMQLRDF